MDNPKNHALVQTKLAELGHPHAQVKFIQAEAPAGWKSARAAAVPAAPAPAAAAAPAKAAASEPVKTKSEPASFDKNDFKNDPLIQKALEVFKGQIVEVRS